ncbi:unnamed protein product [Camellia sinensis]
MAGAQGLVGVLDLGVLDREVLAGGQGQVGVPDLEGQDSLQVPVLVFGDLVASLVALLMAYAT